MPSAASAPSLDAPPWEPLGPIPVDQAGAGRRGYVLPSESADVTAPGANQWSFHVVAANTFYREETDHFLITQRFETHTVGLGYRRGFKVGAWPRFELGGQIQFTESDTGVLNGFIGGFEDLWVSITGSGSAKNQLRTSAATQPPPGTVVVREGQTIYRAGGTGSGFGDVYLVGKALLLDGDPSSTDTRVAARVAFNLSGSSEFTEGNFAGIGVSVDRKLLTWMAVHGDLRTNIFLDRSSQWGLPLSRASLAFSVGPELRLARYTSISLQIDGCNTPYLPTGVAAFDEDYGDITLGLAHEFKAGGRRFLAQVYARENLNLPLQVRWNTDPDFSIGVKATVH